MKKSSLTKFITSLKKMDPNIRSWVFISIAPNGDITLKSNEGATQFEIQSMQSAMSSLVVRNAIGAYKDSLT